MFENFEEGVPDLRTMIPARKEYLPSVFYKRYSVSFAKWLPWFKTETKIF